MPVRLGGNLLLHREESLHLAQVQQGVPVGVLLEDHLLCRLRGDASLEVVGHFDRLLGDHGPVLIEVLEEGIHLSAVRIEIHPDIPSLVFLLIRAAHRGLVRRGQRLLQAVKDRLERDSLLALELLECLDQLRVHRSLRFFVFSSASQSNTVRAEAMSSYPMVRWPSPVAMVTPRSPAATTVPAWVRDPSTGPVVRTRTVSPTLRAKSEAPRRGRSTPGELTSSWYGPGSNSSTSSRREIRSLASVIESRSTPPSRSTVTRSTRRPCSRPNATSTSSRPAASTTGRTTCSRSIAPKKGVGAPPTRPNST